MPDDRSELLFSYGTLQLPEVQLAQFKRLLEGEDDAMPGFGQSMVEITDPEVLRKSGQRFHPIVIRTGDPADSVAGKVFAVTPAELDAADEYEVSDYKRELVTLASGRAAWVYVKA
ncbi:gamma-glutamylcyclotransferase [Devosia oryziradicis]|uniref:Gamma-glutamylcyclotransferase n=1 Tax=Devosia oryziradicis TaxID=2801335 RepID=A0ABX7BUX9_9HYPH|nr:gamma-glutamylcyclotransferase family protein [Devosia oryziradicis]QQR35737.1 gamma-glutamylcyclotransferase [Devosia oryziradicis]